jgi:maleate isomerase
MAEKPMIGFRARLGLLIPSTNVAAEAEFYTMAPPGVTFHFGRLEHRPDLGIEKYERMVEELATEVAKLSHAGVRAIAFACTTGSLYGGKGYNERLEDEIKHLSGVPATSTASAVVEALSFLNAKRLLVLTPYSAKVNELEKRFLEAYGFAVEFIGTLDNRGLRHSEIGEELLCDQVRKLGSGDSEAVFLSCTGLPTITLLERLEAELKKPVISSNQATLWKLKNMVGLNDPIRGFGSLLEAGQSPRGAAYAS